VLTATSRRSQTAELNDALELRRHTIHRVISVLRTAFTIAVDNAWSTRSTQQSRDVYHVTTVNMDVPSAHV